MDGIKRNILGTVLFLTYAFLAFIYVGWAFYWIYWDNLYYSSMDFMSRGYGRGYSVVTWDRYAFAFTTLLTAMLVIACIVKPFSRKFRLVVCWILAVHSFICAIGIAYSLIYYRTADIFIALVSAIGIVISVALALDMKSKTAFLLPFNSDKPEAMDEA